MKKKGQWPASTFCCFCGALLVLLMLPVGIVYGQEGKVVGTHSEGKLSYEDYDTPDYCGSSCHVDIYRQWEQAMMSKAYTHHWDEIEYFKLAVPHAEMDEEVAEVRAGCNGCHSPLAFLAGDIVPPHPEEGSRANESVSCDVCHTITGFEGTIPFNYNWITRPGDVKVGTRGTGESPNHEIDTTSFLKTAEFCGTCHNEKSPYGVWVKSTHLELKAGPYYEAGWVCQDCHMTYAPGVNAEMGNEYTNVAQHLFHGAHVENKIKGTVEMVLHPNVREAVMGTPITFTLTAYNQKTGHKFPTGSVEDRIVWLHVEAKDAAGNIYHLPVDKKGFGGEEYTIAADVLAYQDMGQPLGIDNFAGVQRDGIPAGNRIFRMPYFDPEGRMTIQQWNTESLGVDYRFGPQETKRETFTFEVPYEAAPGEMTVTATLNYQKLVGPVADFLEVPAEEKEIIKVSEYSTTVTILP